MKLLLRVIVALSFVFLSVAAGESQRGNGGASLDLFDIGPEPDPITFSVVNRNTNAVGLRASQTLNPAVRNLVMVVFGQSNIANFMPTPYVPANASAIDQFNIYDGALYAAADPLLGTTQFLANPALRIADTLITNGKFDRVVIVPAAIGGASVANYDTGVLSTRLPVTYRRLAARGLVAGTNVTVITILGIGETDGPIGTSQAAFTASVTSLIAKSRALGFAGKWFIAKQTYNGAPGAFQVWPNVQAAQVALGATENAGPNADSLVGTVCVGGTQCRQGGGTDVHFSDTGSASYAALWVAAFAASGAPFNFLLKRDLDPAANDNTPMFLNKAA